MKVINRKIIMKERERERDRQTETDRERETDTERHGEIFSSVI